MPEYHGICHWVILVAKPSMEPTEQLRSSVASILLIISLLRLSRYVYIALYAGSQLT
jgi:hypothetical protein